ncbi:MAG: site-specific integrase [Chitinophagaceae bacterium]|nr:site-specific integrase [Chitinophagaceae bacterium]
MYRKKYSSTSVKSYESTILRYVTYMQEKAITATYTDVLNYIGYLRKLQLHPKSLRNNLFAIKIYYRYLVQTGKRTDHPCQKTISTRPDKPKYRSRKFVQPASIGRII